MHPILVLDSGIGGLPYLAWIQEHLPEESLVYVADRLNFPYGEKTPEMVEEVVLELVHKLVLRFGPKLIVIACNTASVYALKALRSQLSIPVVGVVPAVKLASSVTQNGRIGILATELTVRSEYLLNLIQEFARDKNVFSLSAGDIVRFVEEDFFNPQHEQRHKMMEVWSKRLRELEVETVVLGCTHFLHVISELQSYLGPDIRLVDSQEGVGRRVQFLLEQAQQREQGTKGEGEFYVHWKEASTLSPLEESKYQLFSAKFGLMYRGLFF